MGDLLRPLSSTPNEYITVTRQREERGDGQSNHSDDTSSTIDRNSFMNTVSDQSDESSSFSEDVPLISHQLSLPATGTLQPFVGGFRHTPPYSDYVVIDDGASVVSDYTMDGRLLPEGSSLSSSLQSISSAPEIF